MPLLTRSIASEKREERRHLLMPCLRISTEGQTSHQAMKAVEDGIELAEASSERYDAELHRQRGVRGQTRGRTLGRRRNADCDQWPVGHSDIDTARSRTLGEKHCSVSGGPAIGADQDFVVATDHSAIT